MKNINIDIFFNGATPVSCDSEKESISRLEDNRCAGTCRQINTDKAIFMFETPARLHLGYYTCIY